jgi:endoglucanase
MAYFAAQVLGIRAEALQTSLRNRLGEKSLVQNYYGQSLAFFPLALEECILKRP